MTTRILLFLSVLVIGGCASVISPKQSSIDRKSEPYDHATWQRVWPDTTLDWTAWRNTLRTIRQKDIAARISQNECVSNMAYTADWTLQGPGNVPGRVNTIAVKPDDENTLLIGFAGGGIFKSTDAGVNWTPVFDDFPELSIGALAFDPSNPEIVFAGTGDVNMPSMLYNGDGVYRSYDAGNTWHHIGLSQAGIISKIIVNPYDSETIWVATMGNPYTRTDERGVYKTTNGGQTWQKVLFLSNDSGCSSLVMSPANTDVLYASFWNRLRNNSESSVWGPQAKVFKSIDGGDTWSQLTGGLPSGNNGRTGLAISRTNPDKVYAVYIDSLSTPGSLWMTTNGGQNWQSININSLENACSDFGWYFGKIDLNPNDDNDLYFHAISLYRRNANGAWIVAAGGHADSHDLVFCPSGRRYWANDGGLYRNEPGQQAWVYSKNLPATQVYRVKHNPNTTGVYWMGAQDNGIQKGNAAVWNNWTAVGGADGFESVFDPLNPAGYILESQWGNLLITNNNGNNWAGTGRAFGMNERVNWDAPIFRSTFPPYLVYAATYRLLVSPDGTGFSGISQDLTDGPIGNPNFHTVSCIAESPMEAEKIIAGTSDANVWYRNPAGDWFNISAGLPQRYVTSVAGSAIVAQRIFVTQSGFRDDDNTPHIHRSDNNGQTWIPISGDLPPIPVNQLFIVPGHADSVLVAGTDAGPYISSNSGHNWRRLGQNMPHVPLFDFDYQPNQKILVAGTHGRGVWTIPIDSLLSQAETSTGMPVWNVIITPLSNDPICCPQFPGIEAEIEPTSEGYQLTLPNCDTLTLRPELNTDALEGVNTWDLVLISRHILNLEPLNTPYKLIAADANRSGTISSYDIFLLRRLILGTDSEFTHNTSWRFVPSDHEFPQPDNPFSQPFPESIWGNPVEGLPDASFFAIKTGDVDQPISPNLQQASSDRTPLLPLSARWEQDGGLIRVDFWGETAVLGAAQLELAMDQAHFQYVHSTGNFTDFSENECVVEKDGHIKILLTPTEPIRQSADQPFFQMYFREKQPTKGQSPIKGISPDASFASLLFTPDGMAHQPLWAPQPQSGPIRIFPNPSGKTGASLYTDANGWITISDINGKIWWKSKSVEKKQNSLPELPTGTYWVISADEEGHRAAVKWVVLPQ